MRDGSVPQLAAGWTPWARDRRSECHFRRRRPLGGAGLSGRAQNRFKLLQTLELTIVQVWKTGSCELYFVPCFRSSRDS